MEKYAMEARLFKFTIVKSYSSGCVEIPDNHHRQRDGAN
jgi:hypothetical protein